MSSRTPLNSVIGFSEVLQDELFGSLNEKQREYAGHICSSGRHLLQLINDILDLSKVEAGKMELEPSSFVLNKVLEGSVSMFRERAMKHAIALDLVLSHGTDCMITADERKIKQILYNLLSNAVKFTRDGGSVSVSARLTSDEGRGTMDENSSVVQASLCPALTSASASAGCEGSGRPSSVEISVTDTGIGIKPEDVPKLFQEFSQLESPYTRDHEGTGLGLALTKRLVELHGGTIRIESEFGKGSAFVVALPLAPRAVQTERTA